MRSAHRRELNRAARPCPERTGVKRVAMLSMHTSPLEQPGRGDAGGMNVYVMQTARHLAACNIEVEIFNEEVWATDPVEVVRLTAAGFNAAVAPYLRPVVS